MMLSAVPLKFTATWVQDCLESIYEQCLAQEFKLKGIYFEQQKVLPIEYKGVQLDGDYRIDLLVENEIIIEIKSVNTLIGIHEAQILTYMKLAKVQIWPAD